MSTAASTAEQLLLEIAEYDRKRAERSKEVV